MLGGHAIKIIGFGVDGGVPYWTVANSWNKGWGEGGFFRYAIRLDKRPPCGASHLISSLGFFRIKRGSNMCQIENAWLNGGPVAGMPKLS